MCVCTCTWTAHAANIYLIVYSRLYLSLPPPTCDQNRFSFVFMQRWYYATEWPTLHLAARSAHCSVKVRVFFFCTFHAKKAYILFLSSHRAYLRCDKFENSCVELLFVLRSCRDFLFISIRWQEIKVCVEPSSTGPQMVHGRKSRTYRNRNCSSGR